MGTRESRSDYAFLAATALVVIGAVAGFLLGAEGTSTYYRWTSTTLGGEALMAAAYASLFIGGPVGALIGIAAGVLASRRLADRISGTATVALVIAAVALVAWVVKLANGW